MPLLNDNPYQDTIDYYNRPHVPQPTEQDLSAQRMSAHEENYQKILQDNPDRDPYVLEQGMEAMRGDSISPANYATADDLEKWGSERIDATQGGAFNRGIKRGYENTQALAHGAIGLGASAIDSVADAVAGKDVTAFDDVRDWGFEGYKRNSKEAEKYHKDRFSDSPMSWAAGTLGDVVPSMVEAGIGAAIGASLGGPAGAVVGGAAGKFVVKRAMAFAVKKAAKEYIKKGVAKKVAKELAKDSVGALVKEGGEAAMKTLVKSYSRQMGAKIGLVGATAQMEGAGNWGELMERGIDAPWSSIASGIGSGFIELAGGNSRFIGAILGKPAKVAFEKAVGNGATKTVAEFILKAVKQGGEEGLQEGAQEIISLANVALNDPTFEAFTKENLARVGESVGAGALVGSLGGVATNVLSGNKTAEPTKPIETPKEATEVATGIISGDVASEKQGDDLITADATAFDQFAAMLEGKDIRYIQDRGGLIDNVDGTPQQEWQPSNVVDDVIAKVQALGTLPEQPILIDGVSVDPEEAMLIQGGEVPQSFIEKARERLGGYEGPPVTEKSGPSGARTPMDDLRMNLSGVKGRFVEDNVPPPTPPTEETPTAFEAFTGAKIETLAPEELQLFQDTAAETMQRFEAGEEGVTQDDFDMAVAVSEEIQSYQADAVVDAPVAPPVDVSPKDEPLGASEVVVEPDVPGVGKDVRHTTYMNEMEQKYGSAALLKMSDEERATEKELEKTIVPEIREQYQKEHGDKPIVLTNEKETLGVMITPSSKEPGKIQLTRWDDRGFSGDSTFDTEEEAILDAYKERFRKPNPGLLEKLTTTEKFIKGNEAADATEKWNREHAEKSKAPAKEPGVGEKENLSKYSIDGKHKYNYVHNTEKSPEAGPDDTFGQGIEPAGKYMNLLTPKGAKSQKAYNEKEGLSQFEIDEISFDNPLVIDANGTSKEWKSELSERYGGLTGAKLSEAIKKDGYDGVITMSKGEPSEVVSLQSTPQAPAKEPGVGKEPWEMSREEWEGNQPALDRKNYVNARLSEQGVPTKPTSASGKIKYQEAGRKAMREFDERFNAKHEGIVKQAIEEGKPVPESVLKDYPDLQPTPKAPAKEPGGGEDVIAEEQRIRTELKSLRQEQKEIMEAVGGNLNNAAYSNTLGGLAPTKIRHNTNKGKIARLQKDLRKLKGKAEITVTPIDEGNSITRPKGQGLLLNVYSSKDGFLGKIGRDNLGGMYVVKDDKVVGEGFKGVAAARKYLETYSPKPPVAKTKAEVQKQISKLAGEGKTDEASKLYDKHEDMLKGKKPKPAPKKVVGKKAKPIRTTSTLAEQKKDLLAQADNAVKDAPDKQTLNFDTSDNVVVSWKAKDRATSEIEEMTPLLNNIGFGKRTRGLYVISRKDLAQAEKDGANVEQMAVPDTHPDAFITFTDKSGATFSVLNTKEGLNTFKKAAKKMAVKGPNLEKYSVPNKTDAGKKEELGTDEDIGLVKVVGSKGWVTDGNILILDRELNKETKKTGPEWSRVKEMLDVETIPAKLAYYGVEGVDVEEGGSRRNKWSRDIATEGVSEVPIVSKKENPSVVVFETDDKHFVYSQNKFNVIRNRYPNAKYSIGKEAPGALFANVKGKKVAVLMPIRQGENPPAHAMAKEAGLVRFSKATGETPKGLPLLTVQNRVKPWISYFKGLDVPVFVLPAQENLGADTLKKLGIDPDKEINRGFYITGKGIYIFADGFNSIEEVDRAFFEEVLHRGIEKIIPKSVLRQIYNENKHDENLQQIIKDYKIDKTKPGWKAYAADEFIAKSLKNEMLTGNETLSKGTWQKIIVAVRRFLKRIGVDISLDTAQIKAMVRKAMVEGGGVDVATGVNQFAQPVRKSLAQAVKSILDNKAFVKWFGDSKVVDDKGEPLVVYHGTNQAIDAFRGDAIWLTPEPGVASKYADRAAYRDSEAYERRNEELKEYGEFEDVDSVPESEMVVGAESQSITPVYIKMENPIDLAEWGTTPDKEEFFEYLKEIGIADKDSDFADWENELEVENPTLWKMIEDWGLQRDFKDAGYDGLIIDDVVTTGIPHVAYAAFNPTQIKSIYNQGTFDGSNPDIRKMVAFHGTPHTWQPEPGFPNGRMRLDKISTGEGGAAYGWGAYLAEKEGTAEGYTKRKYSKTKNVDQFQKVFNDIAKELGQKDSIAWDGGTVTTSTRSLAQSAFDATNNGYLDEFLSGVPAKWHDRIKEASGSLYELDIPDSEIPKLLDWDKPLSEQTDYVKKVLKKASLGVGGQADEAVGVAMLPGNFDFNKNEATGKSIYDSMAGFFGTMKAASEALASIGIPGNTHGGVSKGATGAKYVIWDQAVLDKVALLKRNQKALKGFQEAQPDEWVRKSYAGEKQPTTSFQDTKGPTNSLLDRVKEFMSSDTSKAKWEKFSTYLFDKDTAIKRVQKGLPPQPDTRDYALLKSLMGKRFSNEIQTFDEERLKVILKDMADSKVEKSDLEKLLHADHAQERNLQMKRVNARRYIDDTLQWMTDKQAKEYKDRIVEITEDFMINSVTNNDSSINDRRDDYVSLMDELADIDTDALAATIDADQTNLDNRQFTAEEVLKGTPERLQKRIDNAKMRLEGFKGKTETWTDVKDRLSGMTGAEAKKIQKEWSGNKDIKRIADAMRSIGSDSLDIEHDSGAISDGEYDAMRATYENHVPLMREGYEDAVSTTGTLSKPLKLAYGSTRGVDDIFSHVIDRYQKAVDRKYQLETEKALFEMVKENPNKDMWYIKPLDKPADKMPRLDNEGNIRLYSKRGATKFEKVIKIDGAEYIIGVPEGNESMKRWMDAINYKAADMGPIVTGSRKIVRLLAALNTSYSPEFLMTNFMRDLPVAMIHLETIDGAKGAQKAVAKHLKKAIKGIYQAERGKDAGEWGKLYKDFGEQGGKIGWMQGYNDVKELAKTIDKELAYKKGQHPTKAKLRKLGKWVTAMNTAVENGVRLASYKVMLDGGMSKLQAAKEASSLTVDFTQHGTAGPLINSLYMFANAGIQGNVRMIKAIGTNKKVQKIAAGVVAFGALSNVLGALMGGDDDDGEAYYDKMKRTNPELFERNMVFMIPGTDGKFFRPPMPYFYNMLFVLGNEMAGVIRGQSPVEAMGRIGGAMMGSLNPLASATLAQTITPTIGDPFIQLAENKTWSGGPLMPEKRPFGLPKPDSERYFSTVNPGTKFITQQINKLTGGNKLKSGWIDISPETVELMVETFTGSAGRLVKDALTAPMAAMSDAGLPLSKTPGVRKLISGQSPYVDDAIYRTNNQKVALLAQMFKEARGEERRELRQDPLVKMMSFHKNIRSQLTKLNKQLRLSKKQGRTERVKRIKERMQKLKRAYNKRFNSLKP